MRSGERLSVVILGGGFGGAYAGQILGKRIDPSKVDVTLLDRNNYLLFYPLLVEAGVGTIEPRHVVVPIRRFLRKCSFVMAEVVAVDLKQQTVNYQVVGSEDIHCKYFDHLILSLGSITRWFPIPGLQDNAYQMKSLTGAIELRDRGIRILELANTMLDRDEQRDLLRHVVVGANFTGVEFAGEYHAFLMNAAKDYPNIRPGDIEVILLEHGDRILNAVSPDLAEWAHQTLVDRGVDIRRFTSVREVGPHHVVLTTGERLGTDSVVWAAGIAPNPLFAKIEGLPLNSKGYIDCESDLRVKGFENVWAVGDCATVYAEDGKPYAATAQTASRQGPLAANNLLKKLEGKEMRPFRYKPLGSFAAIGRRSAAADFLGMNIKGFFGWFLYRGTYLAKMPTLPMKIRLGMDWFLELILPSETVQLSIHKGKGQDNKP
jgi:NADH dehydrogenase